MAHDPNASKERANALTITIALLRDAGADDLVATLTAEQAALLYREVVRAVGRAAAPWRSAQDTALTHDDDDMTWLNMDDRCGPGREP